MVVTYELDILEGYEQLQQTNIEVRSSVVDGGSCGINLTLGLPQFIKAYEYDIGNYAISSCTPDIPYDALQLYLETGQDSFIPESGTCFSWPSDSTFSYTPIFNKDLKECEVWKDADHINGYIGAKDQRKYSKIWRDKVDSTKPKKKRP